MYGKLIVHESSMCFFNHQGRILLSALYTEVALPGITFSKGVATTPLARPVRAPAHRGARVGHVLGRLSGLWTAAIEQL